LITHGPPNGIGDRTSEGVYAGCRHLRREVLNRVRPRLHLFGHIHEAKFNNFQFINVSYLNEYYEPVYDFKIIDLGDYDEQSRQEAKEAERDFYEAI